MPRQLKTYVTSIGFFDLAIAAPTMKAALEAWGAGHNLFQQGFAAQTDDPAIIKATMAKPGVVLKRAVGSKAVFTQDAALPKTLPVEKVKDKPAKAAKPKPEKKPAAAKADEKAERKAQADFEKAQKLREAARVKDETARERERARRDKAVASAQAALEKAEAANQAALDEITRQRATLDKRVESEEARWEKERDRLREAIERAQSG